MTIRRSVVLAAVAWLVVVTAGATLIWAVISRAGEGVGSEAESVLKVESPAGQPTAGDRSPSASAPTATSGTTPTRSPATGATGQETQRSWLGTAGSVRVACTGDTIRLVTSSPNPGFRVELDETGPDKVRVEFENTDDERNTRVEATCDSGVPTFEAETED
jgi:hypothetical protein